MTTSIDKIFLGCNYSNKKVKRHFDLLKQKLESEWPLQVVLIDRERGKGARDIWREITTAVDDCALGFFDVSGFRPNVVLELGYALALKDPEFIIISFDERKYRGGKKPEWLLSDITHLNQIRYKELGQLDTKIEEQLGKVPIIERFKNFKAAIEDDAMAHEKYCAVALKILKMLRDRSSVTDQQIVSAARGTSIRIETLKTHLKRHKLAVRQRGPNGRWKLAN